MPTIFTCSTVLVCMIKIKNRSLDLLWNLNILSKLVFNFINCTYTWIVGYIEWNKKEEYLQYEKIRQVVERVWFDWCDVIVMQIAAR
jgi:hypothetical protein